MKKKFTKLKNKLNETRCHILMELDVPADHAVVDLNGDAVDQIQGKILLSIQANLRSRTLEKIKQIDDALEKIESNTYGDCEECDEEIPLARLELKPYVKYCVDCLEDLEREEKARKI